MFFESFLLNLAVIAILVFALTFDYVTKFFSYWYVRHIPYNTPIPFFGSDYYRVLGIRNTTDEVNSLYRKYPDDKFVGGIKSRNPDLIVKDPDVVKRILSTDFANFHSRGLALDKSRDVCLRNNLFYADGEKWTLVHDSLQSLMNGIDCDIEYDLDKCLLGTSGDRNVQELLSSILDTIFKNLLLDEKDTLADFRETIQKLSFKEKWKTYLKNIFPSLYVLFGLITLQAPSNKIIGVLERSKLMREIKRIDSAFQLDVKGKKQGKFKSDSVVDLVHSTLAMFLAEGYVPCLNLLIALLYELARNKEVQNKVRVNGVANDDQLNAVIKETLRLHPIYSVFTRKCVKTYKMVDHKLLIDRGVTVSVPVEAMHRDEAYFKHADVFNPDRFIGVQDESHGFAFLPFGAGPRKCIGEQLSLQIVRSVTAAIVNKYEIRPCDKTPSRLSRTDHNFMRVVDRDLWLKFTPLDSRAS